VILSGLLLHFCLHKVKGGGKIRSAKTTFLPQNNSALLLVTNLCLIDLTSTTILYVIVPNILSNKLTVSESCAIKVSAFCFINLGTTLTTFLIGLERWMKITSFQKHERIFTKSLVLILVGLVWILTLMFCITAFYLTSNETSSSAFYCRTTSLSATPMLITKPSLVLTFSVILFFMYGDMIRRFWAFKRRKEEWQKKYVSNLVDKDNNRVGSNLFKGSKMLEENPPARLTGFKMCQHQHCKVHRETKLDNHFDILFNETKAERTFRYFRDSKYVLCIVIAYFFSWVPWLLTFFTDSILVNIGFYQHQAEVHCGNFNAEESFKENALCGAVIKCFEDATFNIITRFYVLCGASSCVVDPLIYALWYKPIRTKGAELWSWISKLFYATVENEDGRLRKCRH